MPCDESPKTPAPASDQPVHRFNPPRGLPVLIDYGNPRDPFELSQTVTYRNGPVYVELPIGFKCDASSTPFFIWIIPGIVEIVLATGWYLGWPSAALVALFALSITLSFAMPFLMPAVGQLGLHARAVWTHDALFRTQNTSRVVADAVCMEIMEYDGVRWGPRWAIYLLLRLFGWRAWKKNTAILAGQAKPQTPGPEPKSVIVPTTAPASPAVEKAIEKAMEGPQE